MSCYINKYKNWSVNITMCGLYFLIYTIPNVKSYFSLSYVWDIPLAVFHNTAHYSNHFEEDKKLIDFSLPGYNAKCPISWQTTSSCWGL